MATLIGDVSNGDIISSGDLKTGSANSVNDLATRLAAAESTISTLQSTIATLLTQTAADARYVQTAQAYRFYKGHVATTAYGADTVSHPNYNSHLVNGIGGDSGTLITSGAVVKLLDRVYSRCGCTPGSAWSSGYSDNLAVWSGSDGYTG